MMEDEGKKEEPRQPEEGGEESKDSGAGEEEKFDFDLGEETEGQEPESQPPGLPDGEAAPGDGEEPAEGEGTEASPESTEAEEPEEAADFDFASFSTDDVQEAEEKEEPEPERAAAPPESEQPEFEGDFDADRDMASSEESGQSDQPDQPDESEQAAGPKAEETQEEQEEESADFHFAEVSAGAEETESPAAEEERAEEGSPEEPAEEQPAEAEPAEEQPAEEQPAEEQAAEEQPAEEQPAEEQPAEEQPAEEQPAEEQPAGEQPEEERPAEEESKGAFDLTTYSAPRVEGAAPETPSGQTGTAPAGAPGQSEGALPPSGAGQEAVPTPSHPAGVDFGQYQVTSAVGAAAQQALAPAQEQAAAAEQPERSEEPAPTARGELVRVGLSLLSGVLLYLCFQPFSFAGQIAFVALVPWLYAVLTSRTAKTVLAFSAVTALSAYLPGLYWLTGANTGFYVLVVIFLWVNLIVIGLISRIMWQRLGLLGPIFVAALWTGAEYVRANIFDGIPWMQIGYTQWQWLPLAQCAASVGSLGVGFIVVLVNAVLVGWLVVLVRRSGGGGGGLKRGLIAQGVLTVLTVILFFACFSYGAGRIRAFRRTPDPNVITLVQLRQGPTVGLVQTDRERSLDDFYAPDEDKERKAELKKETDAIRNVQALTTPLPGGLSLIVWPGWAVRAFINVECDAIAGTESQTCNLAMGAIRFVTERLKTRLVLATPLLYSEGTRRLSKPEVSQLLTQYKKDPPETRSIVMFGQQGEMLDRYNKRKLIPFAEYTPLRKAAKFLSRYTVTEIIRGVRDTLFTAPVQGRDAPVRFAPLLSTEETDANRVRRARNSGAGFIVSIADEGWFKGTNEPYQRLGIVVFRAIETRTCIVRASNGGFSCIVDPTGRVTAYAEEPRSEGSGPPAHAVRTAPARKKKKTSMFWNPVPSAPERGASTGTVLLTEARSGYLDHGDWFAQCCLALCLGMVLGVIGKWTRKI